MNSVEGLGVAIKFHHAGKQLHYIGYICPQDNKNVALLLRECELFSSLPVEVLQKHILPHLCTRFKRHAPCARCGERFCQTFDNVSCEMCDGVFNPNCGLIRRGIAREFEHIFLPVKQGRQTFLNSLYNTASISGEMVAEWDPTTEPYEIFFARMAHEHDQAQQLLVKASIAKCTACKRALPADPRLYYTKSKDGFPYCNKRCFQAKWKR